ncbi:DUF1800 domain-containing protein [Herbaspirillum sp. RV1423]|uniref:DUF1800 domain-containing protein n=1 Tax=Herbaspirillum sp. RV1423 TaxID=1443993 RepID=UPI001E65AA02|nr:DUF1800 domain-containing protein [Herbaspirillum sp. RV1423]
MLALSLCGLVCAQALNTREQALHVLNRLAYGPRPGDVATVEKSGVKRYIDDQLHPERIPFPADLQGKLDGLSTYNLTTQQLYVQYGPPSFPPNTASPEDKNAARQRAAQEITPQSHLARLWLATESPRQLQEVMTEFWFNHFNVFEGKEWVRYWNAEYEKNAIRPNALGNFRQLLGAVAHHPAMLYYLDNWLSSGAGTRQAQGRFKGLNENYARELMELHTLGVNGGYTQTDVIALARILSGWTIDVRDMKQGSESATFVFNPLRHDAAAKQFLGRTIVPGGQQEGELALDILARQPATARFVSTKLVQYFVADRADPALVERLSQRFLATNGDIREVLRTLFDSPQFWSRQNYQSQFKTPYQFVVSALRATATPVVNGKPVSGTLNQFGMPLYGWLTPEGYKYSEEAWLNPDALLRRINFANSLGNGKSPIARPENTPPPAYAEAVDPVSLIQTLAPMLDQNAVTTIATSPPNLQVGLILGGPAFMKR